MNTNNQLYTAWSTILTFYIYVMIKKLMLVETAVIIRDKHINLNKPHRLLPTHYMTTIQQLVSEIDRHIHKHIMEQKNVGYKTKETP